VTGVLANNADIFYGALYRCAVGMLFDKSQRRRAIFATAAATRHAAVHWCGVEKQRISSISGCGLAGHKTALSVHARCAQHAHRILRRLAGGYGSGRLRFCGCAACSRKDVARRLRAVFATVRHTRTRITHRCAALFSARPASFHRESRDDGWQRYVGSGNGRGNERSSERRINDAQTAWYRAETALASGWRLA